MRARAGKYSVSVFLLLGLVFSSGASSAQDAATRLAELQSRLANVQSRSMRISDINEIQNLQGAFGYYFDKMLWEHVLDLLSDEATLEFGLSGVFVGKDRIREYLYGLGGGREGPIEGVLFDHLQLQPIITISDDGRSARGRWRSWVFAGVSGSGSGGDWGEGPWENEYVKEADVWKISKLHWYATFMAPYEGGWLNADADDVREHTVVSGVEPDEPTTAGYEPFPTAYTPPLHFSNPGRAEQGEAP
jgi:hypothetical protein